VNSNFRFLIFNLRCALVACALLLAGCDSDSTPAASARILPQAPSGTGIVRGIVRFSGQAPEPRQIENQGCHTAAEPIFDETVVVNSNGTLANVIISIEGIAGGPFDGSSQPQVKLDQKSCAFVPHVVAVQVRQPLNVSTSDPTTHNVHYIPAKNPADNFGLRSKGESKTISFEYAEVVRVKCDVHPWMTAYVGVFDHPYFAVTDDVGSFEVKNLPAGTYTLVAWHELFGKIEKQLQIKDATPVEVEFEYAPPQ